MSKHSLLEPATAVHATTWYRVKGVLARRPGHGCALRNNPTYRAFGAAALRAALAGTSFRAAAGRGPLKV